MSIADFHRTIQYYAELHGEHTPVCISLDDKNYSIAYAGLLNGSMVVFELTDKSHTAKEFLQAISVLTNVVHRYCVVDSGVEIMREIHGIGYDKDDACITISLY